MLGTILTVSISLLQAGYSAYSWVPAMGYGTTVDSPNNITGSAYGVPSGYEYIVYSSWVRDYDEYTRLADNSIVELKNTATTVFATINSGTIMVTNNSYDDSTNKRTIVFTIKAQTVATDQVIVYRDSFVARDTGSVLLVKDEDGARQDFLVTVAGPTSNSGAGGID